MLQAMTSNLGAYNRQATVELSASPDERVAQTIGAMIAFAEDAGRYSPAVNQAAQHLAKQCGQMQQLCQAQRVYEFLARHVRFKADPVDVEHLRHPDQLVGEIDATGMTAADCDCQATLGAALLIALGIPALFAVDGLDARGPLQHVYTVARVNGRDYPMDAQHRTPFGTWPKAGRRQLWPVKEPQA